MGETKLERSATAFHTTSWTMIESIADPGEPGHDRALATLVERYWPPVYATLRRMGHGREQAAEETQAFFADVVLGRELFGRAQAGRGRLRTLIRASLRNYLCDRHRRAAARPELRSVRLGDLDAEERFLAAKAGADPDEVFEQRWTVALIDEAIGRCAAYFASIGLPAHWEAFGQAVLRPAVNGSARPSRDQLATDLGFAGVAHLGSAIRVVRKRMKILLREVTAETAATPEEQDDEFRRLRELLA